MKRILELDERVNNTVLSVMQPQADEYANHRKAVLCLGRVEMPELAGKASGIVQKETEWIVEPIAKQIVKRIGTKRVSGLLHMLFDLRKESGYEWQILDLDDEEKKALVIMKNCVAQMPYHNTYEPTTWEKCTLRQWLNHEYLASLPPGIRARVCEVKLSNKDNLNHGTKAGADTTDKVFLPDIEEARLYFEDNTERIACYEGERVWWWLRSPGYGGNYAALVHNVGSLRTIGHNVSDDTGGVRPAFWLNL
ncbi:MAG: DUF6273 domain-containing protein [Clostridiales Family XIII bacterium]|nr:DUF6273 domain-containing protein [Clostridiales Family XIII bacterium]